MFLFMVGAIANTTATTQVLSQLECRDRAIAAGVCKKGHQTKDAWDAIVAASTGVSESLLAAKIVPGLLLTCSGGFLSDRVGRRWLMVLPILGELLWAVAMVLAQRRAWSLGVLPAVSVLCGLSGNVTFFLGLAFAAMADGGGGGGGGGGGEGEGEMVKHKKFSSLEGALNLASTTAPLAVGALIDRWGFQAPFALATGSMLLAVATLPLLAKRRGETGDTGDTGDTGEPGDTGGGGGGGGGGWREALPWRVVARVGSTRGQRVLLLCTAVVAVTFYAWLYSFILWLVDRFGATPAAIGAQLSAAGALRVAANVAFGVLAGRRLRPRATVRLCFGFSVLWFAGLALTSAAWQVFVASVAGGFGAVGLPLVRSLVSDTAGAARQGETLAAVAAIEGAMQLVASIGFLELYKVTLSFWSGTTYALCAAMMLGATALVGGGGGGGAPPGAAGAAEKLLPRQARASSRQ